jgi:UDP-glucose 4-epimerase
VRIFEQPRVRPYRKFAPNERVEWLTGDFLSMHDVGKAVEGTDAVLHLISTTLPHTSNDDPIFDVQSNVVASLQLASAMVTHRIPKIVFISSGGTVYGRLRASPINEEHPTDPLVSCGVSKLAIEKFLLMFERMHGIQARILRVSNAFGERHRVETGQGAIGVFLDRALCHKPIEIWGDGSIIRDYIYVDDVAEAFARALEYSGRHSVFNVSSAAGTSLKELVRLIEDVTGERMDCRYLPARPFDVPVSVLDNGRARAELGWAPRVSLSDGIARTAAWMRSNLTR